MVHNWQVVKDTVVLDSRIVVASHIIDGFIHYGLVRMPADTNLLTCPLPVLLYLHGGLNGLSLQKIDALDNIFPTSLNRDSMIVVAPSFRSEPLLIDQNVSYYSQGTSTEMDKDADDALTFLNGAIANFPQVDTTRITVIGFSRGGNVAYKVGIREPKIKAMNIFFAATNFFDPILIQDAKNAVLNGLPPQYFINNIVVTNAMFLYCLGMVTAQEARKRMLSWSPAYFADFLPRINAYHGSLDTVVPITQPYFLDSMMNVTNPGNSNYQVFEFATGEHSLSSLPGFEPHAVSLIREVIRPSLFLKNDSLFSQGDAPAYQWYLNGIAIPNATGKSIHPNQVGLYQLEHIVQGSCSYFSKSYNQIATSVVSVTGKLNSIGLYYDPVDQAICLPSPIRGELQNIAISNLYGQVIFTMNNPVDFPISVEALGLPSGIYLFHALKVKGTESLKFFVR
jgi:acetyl esterase/lipase